jgi:hypothetical protein
MRFVFRFILLFYLISLTTQVTIAQSNTIAIGDVTQGEITVIQPTIAYSFDGRAGDVIYFYISPAQIDQSFYGRLFDANNNLLIETGAFPFINNFTLPATQTYTLLIGNNNDETGAFTLLVDFYQPQSLSLDTTASGGLASNAHLAFYTLNVTAGTLFRYSTTGERLGVSILDPNGELVVFTGTYDSPLLMLGQFAQTGQHLLIINTDLPTGVDYGIFLQAVEPISLVAGTPVTGSRQVTNPPVFSFQSPAGKAWELNAMMSSGGDRRMVIAQLEGRPYWDAVIALDSGSGVGGNPRIAPFIAPIDATYYVWLEFSPYDNNITTYDYTVSISSTTILSLAPDVELAQTITPQTGAQTFVYTTTSENERIELTIRRVSSTGRFELEVVSPEDGVVYVFGRSANAMTLDLTLPVVGLYRFTVNDVDYEPTELQFTIRLRQLQNK